MKITPGYGHWLLLMSCCAVLAACPSRTGIQQGQGQQTVHERESVPGARAFLIERADQLLSGPGAEARVGDFRMENPHVVVLVGDVDHQVGFGASGGTVLDAAMRHSGQDALGQLLLFLDNTWPRQALYREVLVVEPGGAGKRAVLEVHGRDTQDASIVITTRYILPADARALTIETRVRSPRAISGFELGDALQWGHSRAFAPGVGHALARQKPTVPWLAAEAPGVSYGWVSQSPTMTTINGAGWSDANVITADLEPGKEVLYTRHLTIGDGSLGSALEPIFKLGDTPTREVSGTVTLHPDGKPVPGARVEVLRAGQPYAAFNADAEGRFKGVLPSGVTDFTLQASTSSQLPHGGPVPLGAEPMALKLDRSGALDFELVDGAGNPMPGKLTFKGTGQTPDPRLGPAHMAQHSGHQVASLTGSGQVELPPGTYTVYASRGPEYDLDSAKVDLKPGQPVKVRLALKRVLDTTGYLAGDFHQHAVPSPDSLVPLKERVLSNIVEGVEILGSSDHNHVTDYRPIIKEMKAERWLASVVGNEVTTSDLGHFNAYPIEPRPKMPAGGAIAPADMSPAEIFAALRAVAPERKVIQVNHPRASQSGYFTAMGLEPGSLKASDDRMSWDFDAVEVFNGHRVKQALEVMDDWFAMLNKGGIFVAMGNSDTHAVLGDEPGYARTMVYVGHDDPAAFTAEQLVEALTKARRAVITNGPMIEASLGGVPVGGFIKPQPGQQASLKVRVQAAPWISVDRVEVIVGGEVVHTWGGLADKVSPVRVDETLQLPIDKPGWVVIRAIGDLPMAPVVSGERSALAFTNPIWIGELVQE